MATVTITTTAGQDSRLVVAFGNLLHPGRNATQQEIKDWLIEQMRVVVRSDEDRIAKAAVTPPASFDPT